MNIKSTQISKTKIKLEIEETAEEVQKFFDEAYAQLSLAVEIKGFRPGKAPKLLTIENIGRNRYNSQALDLAIPEIYYQAIKREKLTSVGRPKINIKQFGENEPFIFDAEVDILPEIELGDYNKISIKNKELKIKQKYEADKNEVEKVIKRLQYQGAKYTVTRESAKEGDRVEIDFTGKVDKVQKDQYSSKHYPLILGEKVLQPGFEDKLVGMKKDDTKNFELGIETNDISNPGKKIKENVSFEVKMNDVWHVDSPDLNEDFAKKFGHKKISELRNAIAKSIISEKEDRDRQVLENIVLDELLRISDVEAPESLIDQEVSRRIGAIQQQTGTGFQKYLENIKKDLANLQKDIKPMAEKGVKISLLLGKLAREMGFLKPEELAKIKNNKEAQAFHQKAVKDALNKLIEIAIK